MVSGGSQAKLYAPAEALRAGRAQVACWNLPGYICSTGSRSIMTALGSDVNPAVIHTRVAEALGIRTGDILEFELKGCTKRFALPVSVAESVLADFLVHPFMGSVPGAQYLNVSLNGETIEFDDGEKLHLFQQNLFAGMKMVKVSGAAILTFDGACRNNPDGPAGCGFAIYTTSDNTTCEQELVRGYRYFPNGTSNEMEYHGLIEGLRWAGRLDLEALVIQGDSQLILNQVGGANATHAPNLRPLLAQAQAMIGSACYNHSLEHIPRNENLMSDALANLAIDLKENMVACNWKNVNKQISG